MTSDRWKRIETLFHRTLEKPPEERAAFLEAACGGDASLREEVRTLLERNAATDLVDRTSVKPGIRLGQYEILAPLGKGGMGEVWRARDTTLGRDVAIKALPALLAWDPERVSRFDREARLLAALNHPNIATIHGWEDIDGRKLLVMEVVEGPTLAERIGRGPIPVQDALELAFQIAEAVEAAHAKGIVHRDLKPANIKITPEGRVKLLDFGLARGFAGHSEADASQSPTVSYEATRQGILLGTAAYMSPEQARGEDVDSRTDVWALGCVLFEMLTGQAAFGRGSVTETLARVLEGAPQLDRLPGETPASIRRLILRCLEKNPRDRLQHIGDARIELGDPLGKDPSDPSEDARARPSRRKFVAIAGTAAASAVAGSLVTSRLREQGPAQVTHLSTEPIPMTVLATSGSPIVAISRDGRQVAYESDGQIWHKPMDRADARRVGEGILPFFSPEGDWIGFFGPDGLSRVAVTGGNPIVMLEGVGGRPGGAAWGPDDTIVLANAAGLFRGRADGVRGGVRQIVESPEGTQGEAYAWPRFLPDGSVLFSIVTDTAETAVVAVVDLDTGDVREVLTGGVGAWFVPDRYLVYATGEGLAVVGFDPGARRVVDTPVEIPDVRVRVSGSYRATAFAVSETGTLLHIPPAPPVQGRRLVWVDDEGREEPIPAIGAYPRVSPDGTHLALNFGGPDTGRRIWVYNLDRPAPAIQVSSLGATGRAYEDLLPEWGPDGERVYFAKNSETGRMQVWSAARDGSGDEALLVDDVSEDIWPHRAHRDRRILLAGKGRPGLCDIGFVNLADPAGFEVILGRELTPGHPDLSPDGNWIAYDSYAATSPSDIYIRPFPGVGEGRHYVGRGWLPRWDPRGRNRLYYLDLEGRMMAATYEPSPDFRILDVNALFPTYYRVAVSGIVYDISPRDGRFVLSQGTEDAFRYSGTIRVTLDWTEELEQLIAG